MIIIPQLEDFKRQEHDLGSGHVDNPDRPPSVKLEVSQGSGNTSKKFANVNDVAPQGAPHSDSETQRGKSVEVARGAIISTNEQWPSPGTSIDRDLCQWLRYGEIWRRIRIPQVPHTPSPEG